MRLLLDEHLTPVIALAMRARGRHVEAVAERPDLRGLDDEALLTQARQEGRVLVTENARDFIPLGSRRLSDGAWHAGILIVSPRTFPRSSGAVGAMVRALEAWMAACRDRGSAGGGEIHWLEPATDPG